MNFFYVACTFFVCFYFVNSAFPAVIEQNEETSTHSQHQKDLDSIPQGQNAIFNGNHSSRQQITITPRRRSSSIPVHLAKDISNLNSVEEFMLKYVNNYKSRPKNGEPAVDLSEPLVIRQKRFSNSQNAETSTVKLEQAGCQPEPKSVGINELGKPLELNSSLFHFPVGVRINRCGGCCNNELLTCQATSTVPKNVTINSYKLATQDKFDFVSSTEVSVEEDEKCMCVCKIQPKDCTSRQYYDSDNCLCECFDSEHEESECRLQPLKKWDSRTCECVDDIYV